MCADALREVVLDSHSGTEGRAVRVGARGEEVGLVGSVGAPAAAEVVSHDIPEVKVAIHADEVHALVILRAGGAGNAELEVIKGWQRGAVGVEGGTGFL